MDNMYRETGGVFDSAGTAAYEPRRLSLFTSEELCDMRLERRRYTVESLLYPGLSILAGSPKIGKSWMVMYLCLQIAKGEPVWGLKTTQGSVLYIALEDSSTRLQERVLAITDKSSPNLYFSLDCAMLGDALEEEIRSFKNDHPDAALVAIDTFQKIRAQNAEMSYANDYTEVSRLKNLADELGIVILLVHHTRKQSDSDYMNEISGTNGIAGSADTLMVLKKEQRISGAASLYCTGRDIGDRELTLRFDGEKCLWELRKDSYERKPQELPKELINLIAYMMVNKYFFGSTSAFTESFCKASGIEIAPNQLKRLMNRYRYQLEDEGVIFATIRRPDARMLSITYNPPEGEEASPEDDEAGEASSSSYDGDLF